MSNPNLKRKFEDVHTTNSITNRSEILNEKLSHRPDRDELISKGILHDSQCAPSLQIAEQKLKRARLADELNTHLLNRPGPLDLIQNHILHIETTQHSQIEQAIQDGSIPFKKTTTTTSRPLIFHEYTGPPSSCKPKITKMDRLKSSSNAYQIRLAQQELLLELTDETHDDKNEKPLEQMTKIELRDLCKQYQIPSSHSNKTTLIQRIKQTQQQIQQQESLLKKSCENELFNNDLISTLKINEDEQLESFSKELDEILDSIPLDFLNQDFTVPLTNDQVFLQFLLDNNDSSSSSLSPLTTTTTTATLSQQNSFDQLFLTDYSSSLPKITNMDEFDAFLTDFTSNQSQLTSPILSTNNIY